MGDYVYALRSPKLMCNVEVETPTGKAILKVGSMSYLFKPNWYNRKSESVFWRIDSQLVKLWQYKARPEYVAFTDSEKQHKIKVGQTVYAQKRGGSVPSLYNDGSESLIPIGKITRVFKN